MKMKMNRMLPLMVLGVLFVSAITLVADTSAQSVDYTSFSFAAPNRFNDSYVEGKGFSAGAFRAAVMWSNASMPGSIITLVNHQRSFGVATVEARNGTWTVPLLAQSFLFMEYVNILEVANTGTSYHVVKRVNLRQADWTTTTQVIASNDSYAELILEASTQVPYTVGPANETVNILFRYHAYLNQTTISGYQLPHYQVSYENGHVNVEKQLKNVTESVNVIRARFKIDHEITNWSPASTENKILIGFNFGLMQYWNLYVERVLRAYARDHMEMREERMTELRENSTLHGPLKFEDESKIPAFMGWVPTATVDGAETPVSVMVGRPNLRNTIIRTDTGRLLHVKGVVTHGYYIYQAGSTIYHDPDIYTESIGGFVSESTSESNNKLLSISLLFIIPVALLPLLRYTKRV